MVHVEFVVLLGIRERHEPGNTLGSEESEEPLRSVLNYISFDTQLANMMKGVLDSKSLVFFLSIIVLSLMVTHRSVEAQRWT